MFCSNKIVCIITFLISFSFDQCLNSRIYFSKCGVGGFGCTVLNGKYRIIYQCPPAETDALFFVWQFRAPSNTERLVIKNCTKLSLSFQCTNENLQLNYIEVVNVTNLFMVKTTGTRTASTFKLENIHNLEYIPENTFTQIKRMPVVRGCTNPLNDFQNLQFNEVNIGTIAPKAFNNLKDFGNFSWKEVTVKRLQHVAIELEFSKVGNFSIRNSILEVCEPLSFKLISTQAEFVENKFIEISSGAINGTIGTFTFRSNTINIMNPHGISILSEKVSISNNRFEYLRSGSFENIGPGLLENSQRNFGKLKFVYEFKFNTVNFLDAGSLNPDMQAYDNVATELEFHHNNIFCSCENLGWLFSHVGYGHNTILFQDFYDTIVEKEYKNWCSFTSCDLPIYQAKFLVKDGKCLENETAQSLCIPEEERKKSYVNPVTHIDLVSKGNIKYLSNHYVFFVSLILLIKVN